MIPINFELLDNNKYFDLYYNQNLELCSHMNFFKNDTYEKMIKDTMSFLNEEHNMNISKHNAYMVYSTVVHQGNKKVLTNIFGKPKNTIRLGEGRASVWFIKINGKVVMLFADNRGMSVEIEPSITDDEYMNIMLDLFKCLYVGYEKYNEQLMGFIKNFKIT